MPDGGITNYPQSFVPSNFIWCGQYSKPRHGEYYNEQDNIL